MYLAVESQQKEQVGLNAGVCDTYLPLLWPVQQSWAAVEHNDVILTLGLLSKQHVAHTAISHVSLLSIMRNINKCASVFTDVVSKATDKILSRYVLIAH